MRVFFFMALFFINLWGESWAQGPGADVLPERPTRRESVRVRAETKRAHMWGPIKQLLDQARLNLKDYKVKEYGWGAEWKDVFITVKGEVVAGAMQVILENPKLFGERELTHLLNQLGATRVRAFSSKVLQPTSSNHFDSLEEKLSLTVIWDEARGTVVDSLPERVEKMESEKKAFQKRLNELEGELKQLRQKFTLQEKK